MWLLALNVSAFKWSFTVQTFSIQLKPVRIFITVNCYQYEQTNTPTSPTPGTIPLCL